MQEVITDKELKLCKLFLSDTEKEKLGQIESVTDKIDQVTTKNAQLLCQSECNLSLFTFDDGTKIENNNVTYGVQTKMGCFVVPKVIEQ